MSYQTKVLLSLFVMMSLAACTQPSVQEQPIQKQTTPEQPTQSGFDSALAGFDSALAQKLGADEYGMRSYVMVILNTGPADITDEELRAEIFKGHFSNMSVLAKQGKLVLAGPFMDGGNKRGLYIFNVSTIEEAKELVLTDPAVKAGIFTPEFTKYYGSAALMQVNETHVSIQKTSVE